MTAHDLIRRASHDALCTVRIPHAEHVWADPLALFRLDQDGYVVAHTGAVLNAIRTEYLPEPVSWTSGSDHSVDAYNEAVQVCHAKVRELLNQTDDGAVATPAASPAAPSSPRPFKLVRTVDVSGVSGTGVVAEGAEFSDGSVALRWLGAHPSTAVWPSVAEVLAVHGHQGATSVYWIEP